jgi:crotonobetainyl-CoA:carnitine CoA-transferase CaiB-like acyl-CoA transferase
MSAASPFARYAVLELGEHPATALCASHLGALGMRVTALRPAGQAAGVPAAELGYDWRKEVRAEVPDELWPTVDVVLDPGGLAWFDPARMAAHVVWCRVTGDGADPAASVPENVAQARTGLAGYVGSMAQPPLRVGAPVVTFTTAVAAAQAVLAALLRRERSGQGAMVGVSMLRSALALQGNNVTSESDHDERIGFARAPWMPPERGFTCRDGAVDVVFNHDNGGFGRFCEWLQAPEVGADARFSTYPGRSAYAPELAEALAPALVRRSVADVVACVAAQGGLYGTRERIRDLPVHPQLTHLGLIEADERPARPGLPFQLNGQRPGRAGS